MYELHDGGEFDVCRTLIPQRPRCQQNNHRPQALAAAVDDVVSDLVYQDHVGSESVEDQGVRGLEVILDQLADIGKLHRGLD